MIEMSAESFIALWMIAGCFGFWLGWLAARGGEGRKMPPMRAALAAAADAMGEADTKKPARGEPAG